jgi:plasmid maintenance system antidote protein VapI
MTRDELVEAGVRLNGGKPWGWQSRLAEALGVDGSTVRRWVSGASAISSRTEMAINALLREKTPLV